MATNVVTGDIVRIKMGTYCLGQAGINVTHWRCTADSGVGATLDEVAAWLDGAFAPLYKALMCNVASWYGIQAQRIWPGLVSSAVVSSALVGPGTGGANPMSTQTSGLISLQSDLAGRANRGRLYVPFPSETANDDPFAKPSAAYTLALGALATALDVPYTVVGAAGQSVMQLVIWHEALETHTPMSNPLVRSQWATQRRRGQLGRPNPYPPF